ncbi:AfsR/SARP family transcriptional regulator [Kibdelosporangium phytohabitans]|uniref:AfsR/SARP family transcriptional regulator n=2 Tax=Kibdelosporangium phytohabitans TaxID=860235 RepID=UPI001CEF0C95|nr:BTAD domain-containing putative transcriptional regulator [Kibdelosporangium phytohabitans]
MEFRLLGEVVLLDHGRTIDLGPAKQRCVLVALVLSGDHVVSVDQLVYRVWGEDPPQRARATLLSYLSRLRQVLAMTGAAGIVRRAGGYLLAVEHATVDLQRFHDLRDRARGRAIDDQRTAELLAEALHTWRGEALTGLSGDWAVAERDRLHQDRLNVECDLADALLRLGHGEDLVAELAARATKNPLNERVTGQYMEALYRAGRAADALEHYRHVRTRLVEELGTDPSPPLQELQQQILTMDPRLAGLRGTRQAAKPQQLPAAPQQFTGRNRELAALTAAVDAASERDTTVVIVAVAGTAGVGKTALALHWAHQVRGQYPDGQLYLNLRGYDPEEPLSPGQALDRFLRALGVSGDQIPQEVDERATRFRTEVSGRRMLIVLDNAGSVDQIRPLLPGTGTCLVLITSRDSLSGLVAVNGAHRLDLDLLPLTDAIALLSQLIGPRAEAEPDAVVALVGQCSRLPLALRVAAERANTHPTIPLADLVAELTDYQRRLDRLEIDGDGHATVHAVFSWSYQRLPAGVRRTFRLFALHPGTDIDPHAVAALARITVETARQHLETLTRAHLTHSAGPNRYGVHDLLRAYATHQAIVEDTEHERQEAVNRLLDHFVHTAAAAVTLVYRNDYHLERQRSGSSEPAISTQVFDNRTLATAWLDNEHANLVAVAADAARHGRSGHVIALSTTLRSHLFTTSRIADARTLHTLALALARETGDHSGQIHALHGLGFVHYNSGAYELSLDSFGQALTIARMASDRHGERVALNGLGHVHYICAQYELALARFNQTIIVARDIGHRSGELHALRLLGHIHCIQGRLEPALACFNQALTIARDVDDYSGELHALRGLGNVRHLQGRYGQAIECYRQSLAIARDTNNVNGQFEAILGLGRTYLATGQARQALAEQQTALSIVHGVGQLADQARAHDGLAHAHHALSHNDEARHHWDQALNIIIHLGLNNVEDLHINDLRDHLSNHQADRR